jgi:zinc transporter ZupT
MHKAVVCFSIGMRLVQANPTKWAITTGFVVFVALTAPLGAIVGILIQVRTF